MAVIHKPISTEVPYISPLFYAQHAAQEPFTLFFDSAAADEYLSRYSYFAINPITTIICKNADIYIDEKLLYGNPFDELQRILGEFRLDINQALPPFQGGAAGYFGYELYQHTEKINPTTEDHFNFPDMMIGIYDVIIAWDHVLQKSWIISTGYPETDEEKRIQRAYSRMDEIQAQFHRIQDQTNATRFEFIGKALRSNFTRSKYIQAVNQVIEYIFAGDIYQANLSQRFTAKFNSKSNYFDLFLKIRESNPAPFSAFMNFGDITIVSASPERFIQVQQGKVETRPIKGTRPRGTSPEEDAQLLRELEQSEKDQAENIMIVDLLRNDLSKVCLPHSVKVPDLCKAESYATVHHLVSTVTGQLAPEYSAVDLLKAAFPGGSITGAPKHRAIEIIAALEKTHRGPYCGSAGFISFNGDMDTSILIRTYSIKDNVVIFQAGGGIVTDSSSENEYEETLVKARALINALGLNFDDHIGR